MNKPPTKTNQIIEILSKNPELAELSTEKLLKVIVKNFRLMVSRQTVINAMKEYRILKQFIKKPVELRADIETRLKRIEYKLDGLLKAHGIV